MTRALLALALLTMAAPAAHAEATADASPTIEAAVAMGFAGTMCGLNLREMGAFYRGRDKLVVLASKIDPAAGRKYDARHKEFFSYMFDRPGERAVWCDQYLTEFFKP